MKQFMHSFHGITASAEILARVARGTMRSFCLFANQNVESPAQLRQMNQSIHQSAITNGQLPPLIGIDQEGGQLIAIGGGATELPGNMALGATRSPELARKAGQVLGRELLAMGINLNFAPALDVNINPRNPVIGIRSFGDNPELVGQLGAEMIHGLQSEGVVATAKHFPGHGDTSNDSHHAVSIVEHHNQRMQDVELSPFKDAIKADVGAVMTAHIIYTAFDKDNPATLSSKILTELLRAELGFEKLIITDAMDMYAVARYGTKQSVNLALKAGCDIILLAHIQNQFALADQFRGRENPTSVARIMDIQAELPREYPSLDVVGCKEHHQIAQDIADKSITLVRDEIHQIPLQLTTEDSIAVVTVRPQNLTPADTSAVVDIQLAESIRARHANTLALQISHTPTDTEIRDVLAQLDSIDTIIVGTISAEQYPDQAKLITALQERGDSPIVIALRTPYDILAFPTIQTYLCAYGIREATTEAITKVLFGEIPATGILPCEIPDITPQYPDGVSS